MSLDDRLTEELSRRLAPSDPSGAFERVLEKRVRRQLRRRVEAIALTIVVITGSAGGFLALTRVFGAQEPTTPSAPPITNGRIAVTVYVDGSSASDTEDGWRLATMTADGSDLTLLRPDGVGEAVFPSFSPDGSRIAFAGFASTDTGELVQGLYTVNADGSDLRAILTIEGRDQQLESISWSPDGSRIGYELGTEYASPDRSGLSWTIWSVAPDGSDARQVTTTGGEMHFSWSPDGTRIVFERWAPIDSPADIGNTDSDLFIVGSDGTNEVRLTDDGVSRDPAWSPDGTAIAFVHGPPGDRHLAVVDPAGGSVRELVAMPQWGIGTPYGNTVMWSPDGTLIAARRQTDDGACQIVTVDPNDGTLRRLISSSSGDCPGQYGMAWARATPADPTTGAEAPQPTGEPSREPRTERPVGETGAPIRLEGVPFEVCKLEGLDWRVGEDGIGRAFTFEEAPPDGCGSREGFQFVGVSTDGGPDLPRVDSYFGPLDACTDRTGCWVYATPELDGDAPDEILLGTSGGSWGLEVWFLDVSGVEGAYRIRPFEIVGCVDVADCEREMVRTLDWTLPGLAGFSCGRYLGDGSLNGDGTFEWTSEDGDGWDAEEWIFQDGTARVAPLREAASHGDPRGEFARSDHTEICFEAASVPPVGLADA